MQRGEGIRRGGLVAGVDEAGRGPLAGPVVAAAVILDRRRPIRGLADSKELMPCERERLAALIERRALAWSVAWADAAEIDRLNILRATWLAMRRAILGLRMRPTAVDVDGDRLPCLAFHGVTLPGRAIVDGDESVRAISAASIIAKVYRDRIMCRLDRLYPAYGFARHKGYPTREHRECIERFGPCREHRMSFRPFIVDPCLQYELWDATEDPETAEALADETRLATLPATAAGCP